MQGLGPSSKATTARRGAVRRGLILSVIALGLFVGRPAPAQAPARVLTTTEVSQLARLFGLAPQAGLPDVLASLRGAGLHGHPHVRAALGRRPTPSELDFLVLLVDEPQLLATVETLVAPPTLATTVAGARTRMVGRDDGCPPQGALAALEDLQALSGGPIGPPRAREAIEQLLRTGQLASWPVGSPTYYEDIARHALMLPPEERPAFLRRLDQQTPLREDAQTLLRLALYDEPAWTKFVDHAGRAGAPDGWLDGALVPVLKRMDVHLRQQLLAQMGPLYATTGKTAGFGARVPPKRALDFLYRQLLAPEERLAAQLEAGAEPLAAYTAVIRETQVALQRVDALEYEAAELLAAARQLQARLRTLPGSVRRTDDLTAPAHFGWNAPGIRIVGSVPNGKAHAASDWDLRGTGTGPAQLVATMARTEETLALGTTALPVQCCGLPLYQSTTKSPLVLHITPREIALEVYPLSNFLSTSGYQQHEVRPTLRITLEVADPIP